MAVDFDKRTLPPFLVLNEAWIRGSRSFIMLATVPIICQHAHEPARCHGHRLARADCRRCCPRARLHRLSHRLPTARASCRLIATIRLLPAPSNNGPDQAAPSVLNDKHVFGLF
ncbi:hypothetical protein ACLOJK_039142 [Asimina triloba]